MFLHISDMLFSRSSSFSCALLCTDEDSAPLPYSYFFVPGIIMKNIKYVLSQSIYHPVKMLQQRSSSLKWLCFPLLAQHLSFLNTRDFLQACCKATASTVWGMQRYSVITGPQCGLSCSLFSPFNALSSFMQKYPFSLTYLSSLPLLPQQTE